MEQNQSSAPWLRPPNTLCNTDGWRRTRKSTSKITVRSAKKQERLKKHGTQNQSATGSDLETPSLPSLLTQDVTAGTGLSAASQGSPTSSPTSPFSPQWRSAAPQTSRWPADLSELGRGQREGGFWRSREASVTAFMLSELSVLRGTWAQTRRLGYYHGSSGNVCASVPLLFLLPAYTWSSNHLLNVAHLRFRWNVLKFLRKWDEIGGRGRLRRPPQ